LYTNVGPRGLGNSRVAGNRVMVAATSTRDERSARIISIDLEICCYPASNAIRSIAARCTGAACQCR
jgi:hypothetical protein